LGLLVIWFRHTLAATRRHLAPLVWALCGLLASVATARAEQNTKVVVLHGGGLAWQEGQRVLVAELQASGFQVVDRVTAASTPGQLIDELRVAGESEAAGAVAVFRGQRAPRAFVWIPERDDLVQLEAPFDAVSVAPEVLALRIVELLRTRWNTAALPERPAPLPESPESSSARSVAWLVLGPEFSFETGQGPVQFAAGGNVRLAPHTLLELSASTSLMADEPQSTLGTIELRKTRLSLHPMFDFSPTDSLDAAVGAGGGLALLAARGRSEMTVGVQGLEATELLPQASLRARASLKTGALAAMVMGEFSWLLSRVSFETEDRRVLRYSGPGLFVAGGLAWAY
jgi:hypothetical protein